MVYVSIDQLTLREDEGGFIVDMSVIGICPRDKREVMELLTRVFSQMEFDYLSLPWGSALSRLGYFLSELSRGKIHLATIPKNTYHTLEEAEQSKDPEGVEGVADVFVDVGSPFRHLYIVVDSWCSFGREEGVSWGYEVIGVSPWSKEAIKIHVDFDKYMPECTAPFCTESFLRRVKRLMRDEEIHIAPYPALPRDERKLLETVLKLSARGERKKTQDQVARSPG
jgi:hypothetical protein